MLSGIASASYGIRLSRQLDIASSCVYSALAGVVNYQDWSRKCSLVDALLGYEISSFISIATS